MKIAILGYGIQGKSALNYWKSPTNEITICDRNPKLTLPDDVDAQLGSDYLSSLGQFDLIVRSQSVKTREIIDSNNPEILSKITTANDEFFKVSPTKNIIGVTGTKGKGTTCALIVAILNSCGLNVYLAGNYGVPPLDLLKEGLNEDDWIVLELASFQLEDAKYSPKIGVCLMVTAEHLDWHGDMESYVKAKQQMFVHQSESDVAIYFAKNELSKKIVSVSKAKILPYYEIPGAIVDNAEVSIEGNGICKVSELKLIGEHNLQNVCAAVTTCWQVNQDVVAIKGAVTSFAGLEHRLELVRDLDGVKFYNDSFASVSDATIAAVRSIPGSKVLIIGGFDRQLPLSHLAKELKDKQSEIRKIVIIGASSKRVAEELTAQEIDNFVVLPDEDMKNIVSKAKTYTKPGDSVVLSPGFPSFDMFKDFEERGSKFKQAVKEL